MVVHLSPNSFQYQPLEFQDSIRLIEIQPSPSEDAWINCTIFHTRLTSDPDYVALSYTWALPSGDTAATETITLNGSLFKVQANLANCLREFRRSLTQGAIWVDAICISQDSYGERSHQVNLMRDIYSNARVVHIWLGNQRNALAEVTSNGDNQVLYRFVEDSVSSNYWRRAWIVQEVVLAASLVVHYGDQYYPWEQFMETLESNPRFHDFTGGSVCLMLDKMRTMQTARPGSLSKLLQSFRYVKATDPKDHIYAFLGLASDCQAEKAIKADYSIPTDILLVRLLQHDGAAWFPGLSRLLNITPANFIHRKEWITKRDSQQIIFPLAQIGPGKLEMLPPSHGAHSQLSSYPVRFILSFFSIFGSTRCLSTTSTLQPGDMLWSNHAEPQLLKPLPKDGNPYDGRLVALITRSDGKINNPVAFGVICSMENAMSKSYELAEVERRELADLTQLRKLAARTLHTMSKESSSGSCLGSSRNTLFGAFQMLRERPRRRGISSEDDIDGSQEEADTNTPVSLAAWSEEIVSILRRSEMYSCQ